MWAIVVLNLGIHLIGLSQPLVDAQNWRQADTAAIARNFYEEGMNPLYPRIDWRGRTEGYVESEFPLFSWLVALFYKLSGGI
ncbi:MAG: dolichyl-phosphate-mannose--protein mannosyltransferase, partial [Candidatus Latescibacterota bacterium]